MDFDAYLSKKKELVDQSLRQFLLSKEKEFSKVSLFGKEIIAKLISFCLSGKSVRGVLVLFSAQAFGFTDEKKILDIAVAIELLQAASLIHDDIMDNDLVRRGKPSIYAQYIPFAKKNKIRREVDFAKSMGICIGDIGFFLSNKIIADSTLPDNVKSQISSFFNQEINRVGLGQIDDLFFGSSSYEPTKDEIEKLYLYKTARYTFSLPLVLGALIAQQSRSAINMLQALGEHIGLIFQLQDDFIGLYSDTKVSGKIQGSDIRENKKTLLRWHIFHFVNTKQKKELDRIFGKKKIGETEINAIKKLIEDLDIRNKILKIISTYSTRATKKIACLPISDDNKLILHNVISFVKNRVK